MTRVYTRKHERRAYNLGLGIIVDPEDDYLLDKYTFCLVQGGHVKTAKKPRTFIQHLIIGKPTPPLVTDHINRNPLDNRKRNLRHVTIAINALNRDKKYYCYDKSSDNWRVYFHQKYQRSFKLEEEAKEYVRFNKPDEEQYIKKVQLMKGV